MLLVLLEGTPGLKQLPSVKRSRHSPLRVVYSAGVCRYVGETLQSFTKTDEANLAPLTIHVRVCMVGSLV